MPRGGQNAKSKEELKKAGTFKPSRHNNRLEDNSNPMQSIPKPPEHFTGRYAKEWEDLCGKLYRLGVLKEIDTYLIETFVIHWILWLDASAEVMKTGIIIETKRGTIKNPAINVMNEAAKIVNQIGGQYGLSQRARMGIKTTAEKDTSKPSILDFMKGGTLKKKAI